MGTNVITKSGVVICSTHLPAEKKYVVKFEGEIGEVNPGEYLDPLFNEIIKTLTEGEITLDITRLTFMNSSGIKCFVTLLIKKHKSTKVVFLIDENKTWQKTSLKIVASVDLENTSLQLMPVKR